MEDEKEGVGPATTPVTKQLPQEKVGGAMMYKGPPPRLSLTLTLSLTP